MVQMTKGAIINHIFFKVDSLTFFSDFSWWNAQNVNLLFEQNIISLCAICTAMFKKRCWKFFYIANIDCTKENTGIFKQRNKQTRG